MSLLSLSECIPQKIISSLENACLSMLLLSDKNQEFYHTFFLSMKGSLERTFSHISRTIYWSGRESNGIAEV